MSEEREPQEFSTPYRGADDKEVEETGFKPHESQEESGIREEEARREQRSTLAEELDEVEREIQQIEGRLREIKEEKSKLSEDSNEYLELEDERKTLRKTLIDLDYRHKELHLAYKR
jgi:chromosome segregation ATPase